MRVFPSRASWLALLVVTVALSGCSEEPVEELDAELPVDAVASEDGRDLRTDLLPTDRLPGPAWRVGDWFGHHIFFGAEDTEGTHINVIVTEDRGDSWYLVSEDEEFSMYEAMRDIPITGELSKKDLDTTAFGGVWEVYDFPMAHNKTWSGTLTAGMDASFNLRFTATYQEEFATALGKRPGFLVTGVDADGNTVVETDYVPALGWYTRFLVWDVETEDPEDYAFRSISMGTGHDWTGDYVDFEAEELVNLFVDFNPESPGPPGHAETFAVSGDATKVAGMLYSYAASGASTLRLLDPEGTERVEQTHTQPTGGAGTGDFHVFDAVAGDWRLAWAGPAVASGFGAMLFSLTANPGSLGDAGDDDGDGSA